MCGVAFVRALIITRVD